MIDFLNKWYHGTTKVEHFDELNEEPSGYVLPLVFIEYHWTSRIARGLVDFHLRHWQFIWGTVIALASLYYTAVK